eukprot:TRINITY_DN3575_c0_g1_i3.p1 TRINITY_DN3575_c0_g1~~TRINITY_DN3575_c0_g1_i3.p1  ORF type:complete len:1002 (-),score=113.79 TRINITY_DN3575_c0_g1_i3:226-3231(-)
MNNANDSLEGSNDDEQTVAVTRTPSAVFLQEYCGQDLCKQTPSEPQQIKAVIRILLDRGHPEDAQQLLASLFLTSPKDPECYYLKGKYLLALGNIPLAISSFHGSLQLDEKHFDSLVSLADLYKGKQQLEEAERYLRQAVSIKPEDSECKKMLALTINDMATIMKQQGVGNEVTQAKYEESLAVFPTSQSYFNMGVIYGEQQQMDQALEMYENALKLNPNDPQSLTNYGGILRSKGDLDGAIKNFKKALSVAPNQPVVNLNLAMALTDKGMIVKSEQNDGMRRAASLFTEALILQPQNAGILYKLACAYSCLGNFAEACALYEVCKVLEPKNADVHNSLGIIYRDWGVYEKAQECFHMAVSLRPTFPEALCNLAILYSSYGRMDEAIQLTNACLQTSPNHAEAHNNLGVLLRDIGRIEEAIQKYQDCVDLQPNAFSVSSNRLYALNYIYDGDDPYICQAHEEWGTQVEQTYGQTLPPLDPEQNKHRYPNRPLRVGYISPDFYSHSVSYFAEAPLAHHNILRESRNQCMEEDGKQVNSYVMSDSEVKVIGNEEVSEVSGSEGQNSPGRSNILKRPLSGKEFHETGKNLSDDDELGQVDKKPALLGCSPHQQVPPSSANQSVSENDMCDVLDEQIIKQQQQPLLHNNDVLGEANQQSEKIQLYVYSTTMRQDNKTQRFKEMVESRGGLWFDAKSLSDEQLAKKVREDEIDVLVELSGHTAYNRLITMAMKPAPVQVTWIGYPNSTGLKTVDYRITDAICDPLETKQTFTEELVRLSPCFLCYTPIKDPPLVDKLPALKNGFVTFGSFNALCKITDQVIDVWCSLLHSVPNSRLLLKNKPFGCPVTTATWRQKFQERGIQSWRVDLLAALPDTVDHLSVYNHIDMSLDPFPYAGTTTTCESLLMGVPCITMTGGGHAHNVSASLMGTVRIAEEWVAQDVEEYVEIGVRWAQRLDELNELRSKLSKQMLNSPLCDAQAFVFQLEALYRNMMYKWQQEQSVQVQGC